MVLKFMLLKRLKKWHLAEPLSEEKQKEFPEIHPLILQLLYNRGLKNQKDIDSFLFADYTNDLHDPFLFRDMEKAVERIMMAIKKDEKIVVHGDYDADGVSAAVILVDTLKGLGAKNSDVYLPHREKEGYGVNIKTIEYLHGEKTDLIITCDCGISNYEALARAKELEMDVIITDHHHAPDQIPPAAAILHPHLKGEKYPYANLTGGGVALKLAQALYLEDQKNGQQLSAGFDKWLLDLAAISTVADFGSLQGENRILVKYGLIVLKKTRRAGLLKLYEKSGIDKRKIDADTIGWQIAPRINAAGRIDHANIAYQLLITKDEKEAEALAESLNKTNSERQRLTDRIVKEAREFVGEPKDKAVVAVGKNWPLGVVGLVASKLAYEFNRPAFVMGDDGEQITGSARSDIDFHLVKCLDRLNKYLSRYGGHAGAAGFTLAKREELDKFISELKKIANKEIKDENLISEIKIDAEVILDEVNWEFYEQLEKFEPWGETNSRAIFLAKDLIVERIEAIGKEENHLRLMVRHAGDKLFKLIGFCFADENKVGENWCEVLKKGDRIDALLDIGVNEWNGNKELQFKLIDLKRMTHDI